MDTHEDADQHEVPAEVARLAELYQDIEDKKKEYREQLELVIRGGYSCAYTAKVVGVSSNALRQRAVRYGLKFSSGF